MSDKKKNNAKREVLKIHGDFNDVLKVAVKDNPKPKEKPKKKLKK
jgi:hypothetical protein